MRLGDVPVPDERGAEERGWEVARAAFEARPASPARHVPRRALVLAGAALAVVAAALSPPGRAVVREARRAIGVEHAAPALFRLPAPGRLLAVDTNGAWVVSSDGSKRLLGPYREASWSPHGLFVVASTRLQLATVEPDGTKRWTLARPDVRFPRWGGSRTDTRIAYLSGSRLRVVAGDGTGDLDPDVPPAAGVAPAWAPGSRHDLAYVDARGRVRRLDADGASSPWRSAPFPKPRFLAWSPAGDRIALATADKLVLLDAATGKPHVRSLRGIVGLAFSADGRLAVARAREVLAERQPGRLSRIFGAAGPLRDVTWSPDGRWLLVSWPSADQWIFLRTQGRHRLLAVARVAEQFGSLPRIGGWCCGR